MVDRTETALKHIAEWRGLMLAAREANDIDAELRFGNWLFGAERILTDLGLTDLAAAAETDETD